MLETFLKKLTYLIPKFTYHSKRIRKAKGIQEAVLTKKKEKRTLETFSKKPTRPIPKFTYYSKRIQKSKGPRNRSYKKEKKENVRNVLRETHLPKPKIYLPFQPIPRDPEV